MKNFEKLFFYYVAQLKEDIIIIIIIMYITYLGIHFDIQRENLQTWRKIIIETITPVST